MKVLFAVLAATVTVASGLVRSYFVEPKSASLSGWTGTAPGHNYVSEIVTCCWDELDAASGSYVELFAGETLSGQNYKVDIYDYPGGINRVAYNEGEHAKRPQDWVRMPLTMGSGKSFTKGKKYEFRFTRSGSDSIQYYYQDNDPYEHGTLQLPGQTQPIPLDLCARVYGRMNLVDSTYFGAAGGHPMGWTEYGKRDTWVALAESAGLKLDRWEFEWYKLEETSGDFNFTDVDTALACVVGDAGCELLGDLVTCPTWASTAMETVMVFDSVEVGMVKRETTSIHCPPINLWPDSAETNYWARFIDTLVDHVGDRIHAWQVWNEVNDTTTRYIKDVTGWWRRPQWGYGNLPDGLPALTSLYLRLCQVAESVITRPDRPDTSHRSDRILIGGVHRVLFSGDAELVPGAKWVHDCYDSTPTPFWTGVSVHPYQGTAGLSVEALEQDAESLRAIMRAHHDPGELWNTEVGWDKAGNDSCRNARNLTQTWVVGAGANGRPEGGFDRQVWWLFREGAPGCGHYPMVRDDMRYRYPSYYAFQQTGAALVGKRLNGRVMTGDTRDDSVRTYEFEDTAGKRTWVCWRNWLATDGNNEPPSVSVLLPARTDDVGWEYTAYGSGEFPYTDTTALDGWYELDISTRPRFISEPTSAPISRPDLVVDSFNMEPQPLRIGEEAMLQVKITNSSSTATPGWVRVDFLRNDSVIATDSCEPVPGNSSRWCAIVGYVPPQAFHGTALYRAEINVGQRYVEESGTDDNSGYLRLSASRRPVGQVATTTSTGGHNLPLVPVHITSASYERDSTGSTPADSVRVLQKLYTMTGDTLKDSAATAWFSGSATDTTLPFLLGEGRVLFGVQAKDSWSEGPVTWDTTTIVFDTTAATGSIELNSGARFTNTTVCTLAIEASDGLSGVHAMRIGLAEPVELVRDGGFNTASSDWEYSGAGVDSGGLGMAVLQIRQDSIAWARQDIDSDSVLPLLGDTVRLSADLLVQVPDGEGDTCGRLRIRYVYEKKTGSVADSVVTVGSVGFLGGVQALCGQSCLSGAFALPAPWSDTGWTWTAARVELIAGGPTSGTGSGILRLDNVSLTPSGPAPDHSWWTGFDTARICTLSTGAGERVAYCVLQDSCGNETTASLSDSIILDALAPMAHITSPTSNMIISGTANLVGYAYDSVKVAGDTWFEVRKLQYKATADTQWLPCSPDSSSGVAVFNTFGTGHLGWWNTLGIANGFYHLRLSAYDSALNTTTHQITVKVQNGRFMAKTTGSGPAGGEVSLDAVGSDFVGSATGKVVRLGDELDSLSGFTLTDSGTAAYVAGITELDSTHILVADARSGDITKMTKQGTDKQELIKDLDLPVAVATDQGGNIWTLDRGSSRLYKHSPDGTLLHTLGGEGKDSTDLDSPEALAVKGPLVYVADTRNNRVSVYDTAWTLNKLITGDFGSPCAIVVTDSGQLYLVDKTKGTIEGDNELGGHLLTIVQEDSAPLRQLALSDDGTCLVTLKTGTNDILKYEVVSDDTTGGGVQSGGTANLPTRFSLTQPWPNPSRTTINISYAIPRTSHVTVKLYDIAGKLQRTLTNNTQKPGHYRLTWDRKDQKGRTVAGGVYFCQVETDKERQQRKVVLTE